MSILQVRLLGPPTVTWQDEFLEIPRRRARGLLYRLAVDLQPVAREHLVFLFWSETPDVIAHRDLSHLLTHVRRGLPSPDMLQATSDFVFLNPHLIWSDTRAFLDLFQMTDPCSALETMEAASALFRGPFMDGFDLKDCPEFEDWVTLERSAWERRQLSLLDAMIRRHEANDDQLAVLTYVEQSLRIDPTQPKMQRRLATLRMNIGVNAPATHA